MEIVGQDKIELELADLTSLHEAKEFGLLAPPNLEVPALQKSLLPDFWIPLQSATILCQIDVKAIQYCSNQILVISTKM